ncbi:MAG: hypothetical protein C3F06_05815 [Candidatus Methanoperedenaceae archaeon]|nr:MAG: hypothetical protein C3F06_05815 [Candidatus Methanoperedenaceae archaeon]
MVSSKLDIDIELLKKLLDIYYELTGISIAFYTTPYDLPIYSTKNWPKFCQKACSTIGYITCDIDESILNTKGKYQCKAGLWCYSCPLIINQTLVGAFIIGHRPIKGQIEGSIKILKQTLKENKINEEDSNVLLYLLNNEDPIDPNIFDGFDIKLLEKLSFIEKYVTLEHNRSSKEHEKLLEFKTKAESLAHEFLLPIQSIVAETENLMIEAKQSNNHNIFNASEDILQEIIKLSYIAENIRGGFIGGEYLFSWDEVPGYNSPRLIDFLKQNYHIDWVKVAKIEKIDNCTIKVSFDKYSLSLILNDKKTEVNLKIEDDITDKFRAKQENGILNIYGRDDLEIEFDSVNIYNIINDTANLYRNEAKKKNVHISIKLTNSYKQEGQPFVFGSKKHIEQVFFNLIQNAVKYSFSGKGNVRYISITIDTYKNMFICEISNFGTGILPEEIEKIFQRGYRGKLSRDRNRIGSGFGLFTVKQIMEAHNGKIEVTSNNVGDGSLLKIDPYITSFKVYFPYSKSRKGS